MNLNNESRRLVVVTELSCLQQQRSVLQTDGCLWLSITDSNCGVASMDGDVILSFWNTDPYWPRDFLHTVGHKVYFITCADVFCDGYFVVKMFLNAKVKAVSWIKEQTCDSLRAVDGPTPQNKCPVRQTDIQQVQSTHNQTSPPTKSLHILTTHRWSVRVFQLSVKFK